MGVARSIAGVQPFAELFQGATTTVYKGYERSLDRFVLLKVLRPEYASDEALTSRFEAEARTAAKIQHPNVVAVYSFGREEGSVYLIAEFVEGTSLRELLAAVGKLPPELAAHIALQVACGLQAAHDRGILHRDIKPENVLISLDGQVKLADFGMASFATAEDGELRGTLGYMAPEQVLGQPASKAGDLFALGATLFEMLTGRAGFSGSDPGQIFDSLLHHDPMPALAADRQIPQELVRICARLLAKEPAERYPAAGRLASDLRALTDAPGGADQAELATFVQDPDAYVSPVPASAGSGTAPEGDGAVFPGVPPAFASPPPEKQETDDSAARLARRRRIAGGVGAALLLTLVLGVAAWALSSASRLDGLADGRAAPPGQTADETPARSDSGSALPGGAPERQVLIDSIAASASNESQRNPSADRNRVPRNRRDAAGSVPEEGNGALSIECGPWCSVFVDGGFVGQTPNLAAVPVRAGRREVLLRNPEYPDIRLDVNVGAGETEQLKVVLREHVGQLLLNVTPWAEVTVDGKLWDTIPPAKGPLYLLPGRHRLQLRHDVLGTYQTEVYVEAGKVKQLRLKLEELLAN